MKKLFKIIFYLFLASFTTGCNSLLTKSTPIINEPVIDPTLPEVNKISSISDVTSIALEWGNTDDYRVEGYYIYRTSPQDKNKLKRVAKMDDRYASHFLDENLLADTAYYYQISSFNKTGHESKITFSKKVSTLPNYNSVSFLNAISDLPRRVKLIWRPHTKFSVNGYILERSDAQKADWSEITRIDNRLQVEFIDKNLNDDSIYSYRLIAKTFNGIKSIPSKIVTAKTKPLPLPVLNTQASNDKPREIALKWQKSTQDINFYRVYRAASRDSTFKPIVKLYENIYNDKIDTAGKRYFYKVSVIDKYGLESKLSKEAIEGRTLPLPATPSITKISVEDTKAFISWLPNDERAESFIVKKIISKGMFSDTKPVEYQVNDKEYTDEDVIPGSKYLYSIMAVDKFGLVSKASEATEVYFPKSR